MGTSVVERYLVAVLFVGIQLKAVRRLAPLNFVLGSDAHAQSQPNHSVSSRMPTRSRTTP
jgi:hypothetical protein